MGDPELAANNTEFQKVARAAAEIEEAVQASRSAQCQQVQFYRCVYVC